VRFLLLAVCTWMTYTHALVLEELIESNTLESTLSHKTVGYYLGSFDPLHLGHEAFVETFLAQKQGDFIIIYPSWGGDAYKKRSDIDTRLDMLYAVFAEHPNVIVTRLWPRELQEALTICHDGNNQDGKCVRIPAFEGLKFVGMIGSDAVFYLQPHEDTSVVFMTGADIPKEFYRHTMGSCMALPVNSFVVAQRADDDLSAISTLRERKIDAIINCTVGSTISSTRIKKHLRHGESISALVSEPILEYIRAHGLYNAMPAPKNRTNKPYSG
jgi:nicotinic acid mononucleotide adenylyltransferase